MTQSNVEIIVENCNFSKHGAMAQLFLIDAVLKVATLVAETPIEDLEKSFKNSLFTPESWQGCAKEWVKVLNRET